MYCRYCGAEVDEDSVFCASCGKQVEEPSDASDTVAQDGDAVPEVKKSSPAHKRKRKQFLILVAILAVIIAMALMVFPMVQRLSTRVLLHLQRLAGELSLTTSMDPILRCLR